MKVVVGLAALISMASLALPSTPIIGAAATSAEAAETVTITGVAECRSGRAPVGVWIQNGDGGSGWAGWFKIAGNAIHYQRKVPVSGSSSLRVTVGCGGSKTSWASSNHYRQTISRSTVISLRCKDPSKGDGSCIKAPRGPQKSSNTAADGQCVHHAHDMWKKWTGYWLGIWGDAKDLDNNAKAAGLRVRSYPAPHSLVVWEGSYSNRFGHVAAVHRVFKKDGKLYIEISEQNGFDGTTQVHRRTVRHTSGMDYILAPN